MNMKTIANIFISISDQKQLLNALLFLHVNELKEIVHDFELHEKGKKIELITRIIHFLTTDEKITTPSFPAVSCGKAIKNLQITSQTKILKGQYKNDLKTRLFFKQLIGDHFHFTAFGIDWLNEQWMQGAPPTYQDFADIWQEAYEEQKTNPLPAKAEWAYINFIKNFLAKYPHADRDTVMHSWHKERQKQVKWVKTFLTKLEL